MFNNSKGRGAVVFSFFGGILLGIPLFGQDETSVAGVEPSEAAAVVETVEESPEALIARLMEASRDPNSDFESVLSEANAAGIGAQVLLEAQISRALSQGDLNRLFSFIPVLEGLKGELVFDLERGFTTENEFEGFLAGLKALKAHQVDNDPVAFERFAKETFWRAPSWAESFGIIAEITRIRNGEAMEKYFANLKIELTMSFGDLDGGVVTLGEMLEGKKAVLVDFWASWCGPCIASFPELKEKGEKLPGQGVYVVAVNVDEKDPIKKAREVKETYGMELPWLLDSGEDSLYQKLMVDSIPRAVLIGADGSILFNGHPSDPALEVALGKLGVE